MGLFTNRKKDEDLEGLSEAASLLAQFNTPAAVAAPDEPELGTEQELAEFTPAADVADAVPTAPITSFFTAEPIGDLAHGETVDETPAPIAEMPSFTPLPTDDTVEELVVAPRRRHLEDQPRAQAGNVEIDARGLLDLLGVDADAGLIDISEAHQRFLADHQPVDTDDADAAGIKEKIRCEVNTAYASFRLTRTA